MSRILHHVGRNDFKKTRQRQIGEQKERAAQKLKEWQEAEEERKQIEEESRLYKSDWRLDFLSEAMTTAGMGMVNYPAEGDVDLEGVIQTAVPGTSGSGGSGGSYSFGNYDETGNGGFVLHLDTTKYDTLKVNVNRGDASSIRVSINGGSFQPLIGGTNRITISSANRGKGVQFVFNASKPGAQSGSTGASISGTAFQRRTPINVFVPLDDPEANSFIRGGLGGSEERRKKLKDMLEAGNEYLSKYTNITPSQTSPGDIEIAQMSPRTEADIDAMLLRGLQRGDYGTGPQIQKQIDSLKRNQRNNTPGGIPTA
tara:strand:- start:457 stop:1395 length:939 start_codon:yes stop_codon:yes gene_type:complete